MKKKLLIIAILILLFGVFIVAKFFWDRKQNATGRLKIVSSPSAGIFLDNVPLRNSPYEISLKPGEYLVKLIPEGSNTKTVSWQGKVTVNENALTYISRELGTSELTSAGEVLSIMTMQKKSKANTGAISIDTDPAGAIVYVDNDQKGVAPLLIEDVPLGDHEISVYLPGFFRRSQKVNVEADHMLSAKFKLALDKTHKTLEEELTVEKEKKASEEAKKKEEEKKASGGSTLTILDTPTGYLNVRSEPSISGDIVTKVNPEEEYPFTDTKNGWYKITLKDKSEGWVIEDYIEVNK